MPRNLTVRDIRNAIYFAAGGPRSAGPGVGSTTLLGQWFHDCFALQLSPGSIFRRTLGANERDLSGFAARLEADVYRRILGPRLATSAAHLQGKSSEVLALWSALKDLCGWLTELADADTGAFVGGSEKALSREFRLPGWTDSVIVSGIADAVFQRQRDKRWCVVELKLGKTAPEADLAQVCLYHLMLGSQADMALVGFQPERHEQIFSVEELESVSKHLTALIGSLAEVDGAETMIPAAAVADKPLIVGAPTSISARDAASPEFDELGKRLLKVFEEFNAPVKMTAPPIPGPAFVRFFVTPNRGITVRKVTALAAEVQNRLNLQQEPFIGISQGQTTVDIQRPDRQTLLFSSIRPRLGTLDPLLGSPRIPIGVDLGGKLECANLADASHAHILVAGTTGSGKSEFLRSALAGLICVNTPETLRLVLIDPKRNAFNALRGSPFLFDKRSLVYPDETDPADMFDALIEEMGARYKLLEAHGADDIHSLARRMGKPIPRIVCVCDEYADLISQSKVRRQSVEHGLQRLGNKARASGIHLILATQNPSREIVRGTLDANMPCRVGLKTSKAIESKMLLGQSGAEKLLGNGDLLLRDIGEPRRLQAPFLPESERNAIFRGALDARSANT